MIVRHLLLQRLGNAYPNLEHLALDPENGYPNLEHEPLDAGYVYQNAEEKVVVPGLKLLLLRV
jgi:hypothetical protein